VNFTWDEAKAAANARKHGVTFEEAATAFEDELARIYPDEVHDDRWILVGQSKESGLLFVVHVDVSDDEVRLISAREVTKYERRLYEERR
jgi:uncharacterized DUF497 family protein